MRLRKPRELSFASVSAERYALTAPAGFPEGTLTTLLATFSRHTMQLGRPTVLGADKAKASRNAVRRAGRQAGWCKASTPRSSRSVKGPPREIILVSASTESRQTQKNRIDVTGHERK